MGYSARYHAASLAAVFLALAIGILIGVGFGRDVATDTRRNLQSSLEEDLDTARGRADELAGELERSQEFAEQVYPALVGDRLVGRRIGVLAFGSFPDGIASDIEEALQPTGGRLVEVAVLREPPDLADLAEDLRRTRFAGLNNDPDALDALGRGIGRQLVLGGTLLDRLRGQLLSRASGEFGPLDGLIVVRQQPEDMTPEEASATNRLEEAVLDGATATAVPLVGVERTDSETSSIGFLSTHDLATVDHVDEVAGRVAMIFSLLGAEGSFGVRDNADRLLPDLLVPAPAAPAPEASAPPPPRTAPGPERR